MGADPTRSVSDPPASTEQGLPPAKKVSASVYQHVQVERHPRE